MIELKADFIEQTVMAKCHEYPTGLKHCARILRLTNGEQAMTQMQRIVTYLIVLVLVLLGVYWGMSKRAYDPHGLFLPTGKSFAPIALRDVQAAQTVAPNATIVGYINIQTYNPDSKSLQNYTAGDSNPYINATWLYAQELAANAGANKVVFMQFAPNLEGNLLAMRALAVRDIS